MLKMYIWPDTITKFSMCNSLYIQFGCLQVNQSVALYLVLELFHSSGFFVSIVNFERYTDACVCSRIRIHDFFEFKENIGIQTYVINYRGVNACLTGCYSDYHIVLFINIFCFVCFASSHILRCSFLLKADSWFLGRYMLRCKPVQLINRSNMISCRKAGNELLLQLLWFQSNVAFN